MLACIGACIRACVRAWHLVNDDSRLFDTDHTSQTLFFPQGLPGKSPSGPIVFSENVCSVEVQGACHRIVCFPKVHDAGPLPHHTRMGGTTFAPQPTILNHFWFTKGSLIADSV